MNSAPWVLYERSTGKTVGWKFWKDYWATKACPISRPPSNSQTLAAAGGDQPTSRLRFEWMRHVEMVSPTRFSSFDSGVSNNASITSLNLDQVEHRFLLVGGSDAIVSIYDLTKWGQQQQQEQQAQTPRNSTYVIEDCHEAYAPVALSVRVGTRSVMEARNNLDSTPDGHASSVVAAQWYHDTGAFVSASSDGSLLVWDTAIMKPVVQWNPFSEFEADPVTGDPLRTTKRIDVMDLCYSPNNSLLAVGSTQDTSIKLVDIRSGASSHSINHQHAVAAAASAGTLSLQWSPTSEVTLATGDTFGCVRLWDIRKANSYITTLDRDQTTPRPDIVVKGNHYSHLKEYERDRPANAASSIPSGKKKKRKRSRETTSIPATATSATATSHAGPVSALAFTPNGQELVSCCQMDGELSVWDLRSGYSVTATQRHYSSDGGTRPALDRSSVSGLSRKSLRTRTTPLLIQELPTGTIAWVGYSNAVLAYDLSMNDDDFDIDSVAGAPVQRLEGHLDRVTALECMKEGTLQLWSAGRDGMILPWSCCGRKSETASSMSTRPLDRTRMGPWDDRRTRNLGQNDGVVAAQQRRAFQSRTGDPLKCSTDF